MMTRIEAYRRLASVRASPAEVKEARAFFTGKVFALVIIVGVLGLAWLWGSGRVTDWADRALGSALEMMEAFLRALAGAPREVPN